MQSLTQKYFSTLQNYSYSYNGMEKDDEVKGSGNSLDYGARIYDPRLMRWNSVDDKAGLYYSWTPYCFAGNNPIVFKDPDGNDIIIQGSFSYRRKVMAELQTLTTDEIRYNSKTNSVEFVSPPENAVPNSSAGTQLIRDLIGSTNSVTIMATKEISDYMFEYGGDISSLSMPFETFAVASDGSLISPEQITYGACKMSSANTVIHFSDYIDEYPSFAVRGENGLTYEQTEGYLVLGHELFHALYTMEGMIAYEDICADWGKQDYDNAITHPYYGPFCSYHEWEIRRMENFIRSEHQIKERYIEETNYDLIDELDYEAEDHHDPNIDWEEEGTGITSEMIEYWKKYQEKQGNDPARIFNELANAQKSQKRTYEQQSKKAQRDTEKSQNKAQKKAKSQKRRGPTPSF